MNNMYQAPTNDEMQIVAHLRAMASSRPECEYQYAIVIYRGERQVERFCQHPEHWQPNCQIVEWIDFVEDVLPA